MSVLSFIQVFLITSVVTFFIYNGKEFYLKTVINCRNMVYWLRKKFKTNDTELNNLVFDMLVDELDIEFTRMGINFKLEDVQFGFVSKWAIIGIFYDCERNSMVLLLKKSFMLDMVKINNVSVGFVERFTENFKTMMTIQ